MEKAKLDLVTPGTKTQEHVFCPCLWWQQSSVFWCQ